MGSFNLVIYGEGDEPRHRNNSLLQALGCQGRKIEQTT